MISPEEWRNYYETLLENRQQHKETTNIIDQRNANTKVTVTNQEVQAAHFKMKNGRSPGPGDLPIELLKARRPKLIMRLTRLINNCCQQIKVPIE